MNSQTSDQLTDSANYSVNPFLWGNIALLASLPWLLAMTMAGLAVGDPVFASWFEIALLSLPAIAAVAWLQWQQPFYPFCLWLVTQSSNTLSDRDRQALALLKQRRNGWYTTGWIAIAVALIMSFIFCKLYVAAPLAEVIAPFPSGLRFFGIIWAEVFFLVSNAIAQAGISALRIKLTASSDLASLPPIAIDKIKRSFTNFGKSVAISIPQAELNSPVKLSLVLEPKSEDLTHSEPETAKITEPEAISDDFGDLDPEVVEISEETVEPEAIADDLGDLTEFEPEVVEIPEEITEPEAIADDLGDLDSEVVEISEETVEPEAIAEVAAELEAEIVEIPEEIIESEAIADDLGDLTVSEPEVNEIAEIIEPEAISDDLGDLTELEPEVVEITEEIIEPEVIADDLGDLDPEVVEISEETVESEAIVEIPEEIVESQAISDDLGNLTELEPEVVEITEEIIEPEASAEIASELEPELEEIPEEIIQVQAIADDLGDLTELDPEVDEIAEITKPEAIAEVTTELEPEVDGIAEIIEPEAIAEVTEGLETELEEIPEEIIESEAIAEVTAELEPEIAEISEEIVEPEAIAEVATELEIETRYTTEIVINFESDFDIDAEIAKMIAEEEAAKLATSNDWQADTNIENELAAIAEETSNIEEIDDELDELIAFNIYTEKVLENYLTDEPVEDTICESPSNAIDVAKPEQEETNVKPAQILIEEFLVDKYLAKLEELGKADKSNTGDNG